jgi:hypothetical protein
MLFSPLKKRQTQRAIFLLGARDVRQQGAFDFVLEALVVVVARPAFNCHDALIVKVVKVEVEVTLFGARALLQIYFLL